MKCDFTRVVGVISLTIGILIAASIIAGVFHATVVGLFAAAALVSLVSLVMIPLIKTTIMNYATCRGPSAACSVNPAINTLGQVAELISVVTFLVAGLIQIPALAFLSDFITTLIGLALEVIVWILVISGIVACVTAVIVLSGILTQAYAYKSCMDSTTKP